MRFPYSSMISVLLVCESSTHYRSPILNRSPHTSHSNHCSSLSCLWPTLAPDHQNFLTYPREGLEAIDPMFRLGGDRSTGQNTFGLPVCEPMYHKSRTVTRNAEAGLHGVPSAAAGRDPFLKTFSRRCASVDGLPRIVFRRFNLICSLCW